MPKNYSLNHVDLTSNDEFTAEMIVRLDKFLPKTYGLLVDSDRITVSNFDMSLTNEANLCDAIDSVCLKLFNKEFTFNYKYYNGVIVFYNFFDSCN